MQACRSSTAGVRMPAKLQFFPDSRGRSQVVITHYTFHRSTVAGQNPSPKRVRPWFLNGFRCRRCSPPMAKREAQCSRREKGVLWASLNKPTRSQEPAKMVDLIVRCPYCVQIDLQDFMPMIAADVGTRVCMQCGHVAVPGNNAFRCLCGHCKAKEAFGPNKARPLACVGVTRL